MGVELYRLDRDARRTLLVGDARHEVGVLRRLWKATATRMCQGREGTLERSPTSRRPASSRRLAR